MDIQGFLCTLTLDGEDITVLLNDLSLSRAKNVMSKPTMDGTGVPQQLVGNKTGTLSMNGQVDTAGQAGLETSWAKDASVAFSLVVGDGATIKAGTYTGAVVLSAFDIDTAASDSFNFALSGETAGVVYTAPV